jgi:hypothetical protein
VVNAQIAGGNVYFREKVHTANLNRILMARDGAHFPYAFFYLVLNRFIVKNA